MDAKPKVRQKRRTRAELASKALSESSRWLGNANEELAKGNNARAAIYEERAQRWLDRYNDLTGNGGAT